MKQIINIALFTVLTILILSVIAIGQDLSYREPEENTEDNPASEEIMELIYKYDMPDQESSYEAIEFDQLPQEVKSSFKKGPHREKTITRIFEMENGENPSTYVIFMENKGHLEKFHFNAKGKQVKNGT